MRILIDIPEEIINLCKDDKVSTVKLSAEYFRNGTPIPDNATVGEVFCMLACKEPICETASYFTIDKKLWNAPYQKGGKE